MLAYFYFSWTDPTAFATVQQRTAAMLAGGGCELQCSDQMRNQSCCDGIYVPSFTFRQAGRAGLWRGRAALSAACCPRRHSAAVGVLPRCTPVPHPRVEVAPSWCRSNAYGFPQDRPTSTRLALLPDGSVAWTTYVQARRRSGRLPPHMPLPCLPACLLQASPPNRGAACFWPHLPCRPFSSSP